MTTSIPRRPFGSAGFEVSIIGLGGGQLGDLALSDQDAERLLEEALACGINLIDTARSYGASEDRIGRFVRSRRPADLILSTKIGYGVPGVPDWTPACIHGGIDAARERLGVDVIDIVHLHSCPREVLERGEVVDALNQAVTAGKIRVAAYSGDNEAAAYAVASGRFGSVQTSLNLCDQRAAEHIIAPAAGLGVIAKRPVANAPWRFAERPSGHEAELYWERWKALDIDPHGLDWHELALRFTAWHPGVHSAIVGTANPEHLRANVACAARGPLPDDMVTAIRQAFAHHGQDWSGRI
ncbi:aldo/keto reductase [Haliangium sp.]|uniref:aldo/keto reductase n=1 Tax=Haliangium sp. TaxID=2663208 RepID=UPI003D0CE5E0